MAQCSVHTGMLLWKKPCSGVAVGHCGNCHRLVCRDHFLPQSEGPFLCPACAPREDDSADTTGALFGISLGAAAAAASSADGREAESSDSGSSDSGSGDSGGGGDGGSGGD